MRTAVLIAALALAAPLRAEDRDPAIQHFRGLALEGPADPAALQVLAGEVGLQVLQYGVTPLEAQEFAALAHGLEAMPPGHLPLVLHIMALMLSEDERGAPAIGPDAREVALAAAERLTGHAEPETRAAAMRLLRRGGGEEAIGPALALLGDANRLVRLEALLALHDHATGPRGAEIRQGVTARSEEDPQLRKARDMILDLTQ